MYMYYSHMQEGFTHLVKWTSDINGAVLDDGVHCLRDGSGEVWVGELRVEENLWTQESFITHIHCEWLHTARKKNSAFVK